MLHPKKKVVAMLMLIAFAALQSCSYSIIVSNQRGSPQPDPMNREIGFYNGKEVNKIDTVVKLSLLQDRAMVIPACREGGFNSVEYKITFGDMLRNTFTFGKRKSIKVKYVCLKDSNQ